MFHHPGKGAGSRTRAVHQRPVPLHCTSQHSTDTPPQESRSSLDCTTTHSVYSFPVLNPCLRKDLFAFPSHVLSGGKSRQNIYLFVFIAKHSLLCRRRKAPPSPCVPRCCAFDSPSRLSLPLCVPSQSKLGSKTPAAGSFLPTLQFFNSNCSRDHSSSIRCRCVFLVRWSCPNDLSNI